MVSFISNSKNFFYLRQYAHDVPAQKTLTKRVILAAIPFLSLHPSLKKPISIIMGTARVWNTDRKQTSRVVLAVMALVIGIFKHRAGMWLTTIHDALIEIDNIKKSKNKEERIAAEIALFNNLVYLTYLSVGGLELSIMALAVQAGVNLIQSRTEFKKGRWIEAIANLLMTGIRIHQSCDEYQKLKRQWQIEAAVKRIFVGQLHEKWKFPSDHLPVGIEVNGVRIISWNVLNNAYMEWVTDKDSQGINGSMISDLNVPVNEQGLTRRDMVVANMVQQMMQRGQIIALQECSEPFLRHLETLLPANWNLVRSFSRPRLDQDVILHDSSQLTYQSNLSERTGSAYPSTPGRPLQNAYFTNHTGQGLRVINAHIPGDPQQPARQEFARYVHQQHRQNTVTVALGDNNFERNEMMDAYQRAGFSEFSLHSPWKTNIDPATKESKGIDHLFVVGNHSSRDLTPEEVLTEGNLRETIDLLNQPH